jgi:cytochrome c-type biogenesis protein CcmH/NrfG
MILLMLGSAFVVAAMAVLFFLFRSGGMTGPQPDLVDCRARLESIGTRLKQGLLNDSEADAERLALLAQMKTQRWEFAQFVRGGPQMLQVSAAVFLFATGLVATIAYFGSSSATARSGETSSYAGQDGGMGAQLADYIRSTGTQHASSTTTETPAQTNELLPDVNVMIQRLEARLKTMPDDVNGWQMLGWSYFNTGRFGEAANAFEKALQLNPASTDLKASYEEAKAKASAGESVTTVAPTQNGSAGENAAVSGAQKPSVPGAMSALDSADPIRGMVDRLAQRLESSPRDPDGWIQLMRSRLVLGEEEVAQTALQKAIDVFADDPATKDKIVSAAAELGLKPK